MKKAIALTVILLLVVSIFGACSTMVAKEPQEDEIKAICQLATVKCYYNNVAKIVKEKDYIKNPKDSGYVSYHLILGVPVALVDGVEYVTVDPVYLRDETPAPTKPENDTSDDFFWITGGA